MVKAWEVLFTKRALQDAKKLKSVNLKERAEKLLAILSIDPFQQPPKYKKLIGELSSCYSRRINIQYRMVYQVDTDCNLVKVIGMFGHYDD